MRFAYESWQEGEAGRWPEAVHAARFAIASDPTYVDGYRMLGNAGCHMGWRDYAQEVYAGGLAVAPSANLYWAYGDFQMESGEFAKAEETYRSAVRLAPENLMIKLKIAGSLLKQDRADEAVALMNDLVRQNPDYGPALELLGSTACWQRHWEDAADFLTRARAAGINSGMLHYRLALAQQHLGYIEDAQRSAQRALALDPGDPSFRGLLERLSWETFEPRLPDSPN